VPDSLTPALEGAVPAKEEGETELGPEGQAAPETPETKGSPDAPDAKPPAVHGPAPAPQETKPPSYMFPEGGPPEAAYLTGPPPRKKGLEATTDGRGEFGLAMRAPSPDRKSDLTVLGGRPRDAMPSRFLLRQNTAQVQSEIELDLERGTISRSRRIENVVVEDQGLEDIGDHVTNRVYAGRFQDVAKESRTLIGTVVEDGVAFGQGSGMTFASPVGLGPAEAILGKGASITVRGSERISISGTSSWEADPPPSETFRQSKFPQLDLRQDLDVNVDGKVGDKVTIDWTEKTNTDIPLSNRIAILYRGYDDEVVKEVDLGNTALSLPGTQFVSYNGQHQGLFGVKTLSQFGDIGLTVIASKQEGQTASNRFVGTAKSTTLRPADLDYVQRRFFFLVDPVDPLLQGGELRALDEPGGIPPPVIEVTTLNVWRDNRDLNTSDKVPGVALLDPRVAGSDSIAAFFEALVVNEDYVLRTDLFAIDGVRLSNGQTVSIQYPVLDMKSPIASNEVLAATFTARYSIPGQAQPLVVQYGNIIGNPASRVRAKALHINISEFDNDNGYVDRNDPWSPVRRLELRNMYSVQREDIDLQTISLVVRQSGQDDPDHFPGDPNATFLRGLGLDRENSRGDPVHDDRLDAPQYFPDIGMIRLPDLRPFALAEEDSVWPFFRRDLPDGRPGFFTGENANAVNRYQSFYDKVTAIVRGEDDKYFFDLKYDTPQTQFILEAAGTLLEGSETVLVQGRKLTRGTDYTIDYDTGIVNLIGLTDLPPNSDITIDYAFAPLFALGQKSLMGLSVGWEPTGRPRRFGTTWLFESAGVNERRPKLGEEPTRTIVGDLNGGFQARPFLFNQLVDALPGVRASADSRFDVTGEIGLSLPNPNTRGEVYIDDFEGVKDNTILSLLREDWFWSSFPETDGTSATLTPLRGKLIWYNPVTSPVFEHDLFPDLEQEEGDDRKTVLAVNVDPRTPGDVLPNPNAWVGLTQGISSDGADFSRRQFIEIWLNDFQSPLTRSQTSKAEMVVDLGIVDEDAQWDTTQGNDSLDTEDVLNPDGILDRSSAIYEDTGLDLVLNDDEAGQGEDPHNDDFDLDRDTAEDNPNNPAFYAKVNGFEENSHLDSEDVDRDNFYQRQNHFKRYVIPLNDSTYVATDVAEEFAGEVPVNEENGVNGWRLFRIPLEDGIEVGSMNPGNVRHIRLWFTGFRGPQLLQIAGIDVLGSLFQDDLLRDSTGVAVTPGLDEVVKIRGINNKEDPEYIAPFELQEQNRVIEREQSLAIDFESLGPGHEGSAYKALPTDKDFTLYETLKWYVHGDDGQAPGVEAFLRFGGADSVNYYEYAVPLRPGWTEERIPVTELSTLKTAVTPTDTCRVAGRLVSCYEQELADGRVIRLVGQPSLTRVRRLVFGVRNASDLPQTGSAWFDDLRLDDVIRDMGTALRFDVDAGFADFMTLSTRLLTRDEDFLSIGSSGGRSLARGFGSRQRDLNLQSTVNLHKFFETTGIKLPVAFNMTHNRELPEFSSGDDVVLTPEQSTLQERGVVGRTYSANFSRVGSQTGVLKYTLDGFKAHFSLSDAKNLSTTRRDSSRTILVGLNYAVNPTFRPLKLGSSEIRYYPDNITLSAQVNSDRYFSFDRNLNNPNARDLVSADYRKGANLSGATGFTFLKSVRTNYRIDSRRDLTFDNPAAWLGGFNIGWETERSMNLDINWTPPVLRLLAPTVSFRGGSRDNHSPQIQLATDSVQVRDLNSSQTLTGGFSVPISLLTGTSGATFDSASGVWQRIQGQFGRAGRLQDIRVSLSANNTSNYDKATGVPRWSYQLGLTNHPGDDIELMARGRRAIGNQRSAQLASGIDLPLGIAVKSSYSWNRHRDENTNNAPRVGRTVTWPQFDIDWRAFQGKIPRLGLIFKSLNLESRYTHDRSEAKAEQVRPENQSESITVREDWNPIVGVNGTLGKGWSMRSRINSTSTDDTGNIAGIQNFQNSTRRQVSLTLSRRFDPASGIKFFWMKDPIRLKSDLVFNTDVSYSTDRVIEGRTGFNRSVNRDGNTTSLRTGVSYKFRKNLDGEFNVNLGRNNDNKAGFKRRTAGLSGSVVFNF